MNAKGIMWILAKKHSSPFFARGQLAVVPNVSWSMLPWEADLLCCSKAGYLTEIEIKISISDWRSDLLKAKFNRGVGYLEQQMIKRFYYAAPAKLAARFPEIEIPDYAGVIAVSEDRIEILKEARDRLGSRKLTDDEILKLLRLASIKAWGLAHLPSPDDEIRDDMAVTA